MANWLDRIKTPLQTVKKVGLPTLEVRGPGLPQQRRSVAGVPDILPRASLVYGIGAAIFLVFSLFSLFSGAWVTALLLLLPSGCFMGFALYFLRYH